MCGLAEDERVTRSRSRWSRGWLGPLAIVLVAGAWGLLITTGTRAGAAAWFLFPLVLPLLGLMTLVAVLAGVLRGGIPFRQAAVIAPVGLLALYPISWFPLNQPFGIPTSPDRVTPAAHVRVPANVPMVVLHGGQRLATNYHATMPEMRWSYDLAVHPHPDHATAPDLALEDYGCWGAEILAPASGRVLRARDGEPDHPPGTPWSGAYPPDMGNHVVIEITGGTVLLLGHLQEGSVQVGTGDAVEEGAVIGRCGNSGNAVAPHLHIQHQPALLSPERRTPFHISLPLFFRDHDGDPMPVGGWERDSAGVRIWTGDVIAHRPGGADGAPADAQGVPGGGPGNGGGRYARPTPALPDPT